MSIIQASAASLQAQIAVAAKGGVDSIQLTGQFTRVAVVNVHPPVPVTLDCTQAVIIGSGTEILGSSNWKVKGGDWSGSVFGMFNVQNSSNLEFDSLWVHDYALGDATHPAGGGAAIGLTKCQNVSIHDCQMANTQGDVFDVAAGQHIEVLRNRAWGLGGGPNHCDFFQMWNLAGFPQCDSIDAFDNMVMGYCQGFGTYSTSAAQPPGVSNIRIRRNKLATTMSWACLLHNAKNCEVTDNFAMTLYGQTPGFVPPSWVLTDGNEGVADTGTSGNLSARNVNGVQIPHVR